MIAPPFLKYLLAKNHTIKIAVLLLSTIVISTLEIIGISVIPVYLYYMLNPDIIYQKLPEMSSFLFNLIDENNLPVFFIFVMIIFFVLKNILIFCIQVFQVFFWVKFRTSLCNDIFRYYLNLRLIQFLKINPSTMINNILTESANSASVVRDGLVLLNEILFLSFLLILIILTQPVYILISILILLIISLVFYFLLKNIVKSNGDKGLIYRSLSVKFLNQGFGLFKETMMYQKKEYIITSFVNNIKDELRTSAFSKIISDIPRLFIEVISVSIILTLSFYFLKEQSNNIKEFIPSITLFVISFVRAMPSINKIIVQLNRLKYFATSAKNLNDILSKQLESENLHTEEEADDIHFNSLNLNNVSFQYSSKIGKILSNINISINKGDKIAIIGDTGSGKSTLLNLILGLLDYDEGKILLNNKIELKDNLKSWYQNLSFVPQEVYLFDGNIRENIILKKDCNSEDSSKLMEASKTAKIYDFISKLDKSFETTVGDRGVEISGGQKQRIGIARALFNNREILGFDEATSALDSTTEESIIKNITNDKDLTFICVTHRLNTLKYYNKIITIAEGKILSIKNSN